MIEEITATDAATEIENGAVLIDVRNDDEWQAGHAPNARYITLSELSQRCGEVPSDQRVIVICRAGGRSLKAAEFLATQGITAANLTGGMQAWAQAGLAVVDDDGAPGTVI